jgi:hypothetical protein
MQCGVTFLELYKKSLQPLKYLNLLAFIGTVAVNALANILPFNGITTGAVSDQYRNLFAPAGITFAIWGVIYLGLALFCVYQMGWTSNGKRMANQVVSDVGSLFVISRIANMAWIYFWHFDEIALTLLFMLVLLLSLLGIYFKLNDSKYDRSGLPSIFVDVPFRIYLAWVSVATIANITAFLVSIQWNGFGIPPEYWTVIMIAVASILGIVFINKYHDYAYGLVLIWAFAGIIIQHRDYWNNEFPVIIGMAGLGIAILVIYSVITAMGFVPSLRKKRYY